MIDLAVALRIVVDALDAVGAEYVVVGSTAAAAWGVARATRDVDLVSLVEPAAAEDVVLAKLRWRLTPRSEVHSRDCVEIAATQQLDRVYLWTWADQLGVSDDLGDLLDGAA